MFQQKKTQPIIKNNRFYNNFQEKKQLFIMDYFYMVYSFLHEIYIFLKSLMKGKNRLPKDYNNWLVKKNISLESIVPKITWIGHATFLIQIGGKNIITDPIFGDATIFFPRILPPGIGLKELPKIDFVIISHNHPDHMDNKSLMALKKLNPEISVLVPQGDKKWFTKRNFKNTFENNWWQELNFNDIKFTFLPAYHWSQRGVFDQNKSLWGSWMIEYQNYSIYFAGDTSYSTHFKEISKHFPKVDYALMPIGPCEPREKMCHSHISSEEAGQAFLDLNAQNFIPMHWGTFHFGTDTFELPIDRLKNWWKLNELNLISKNLEILKFGQSSKDIVPVLSEEFIQPILPNPKQISL